MKRVWIAFAFAAYTPAAMAQVSGVRHYMTGEHLATTCRTAKKMEARSGETSRGSPQEAADHGVCFGFISAFLDAQEHGHFKAFCPPGELTVSAAIEIVADHFDRNPQHRGHTGLSVVKAALEDAFPCRL
jgi:hypothetical protein